MAKKVKSIKELINLNITNTWAEYADEKLKPKYIVYRYDDKKGNRFYYFKDDKGEIIIAAGVTTVFGQVSTEREQINKWKESHPDWKHLLDITSEYGTAEHKQYGNIMFGFGVDKNILEQMQKIAVDNGASFDMPAKDIFSFLKFQEDYKLTPLLIEACLVWQDPITGEWLAMTIDLLAKLECTVKTKELVQDGYYIRGDKKGQPKMVDKTIESKVIKILNIDFKSNFFDKERKNFFEIQKMQLMAGNQAIEQNFGIKVDGCFNYAPSSWRITPNYNLFEHKIDDKDRKIWNAYWNLAIAKEINKPEGNIMMVDSFKNSNGFKFLSYKEYVEQILMKGKL